MPDEEEREADKQQSQSILTVSPYFSTPTNMVNSLSSSSSSLSPSLDHPKNLKKEEEEKMTNHQRKKGKKKRRRRRKGNSSSSSSSFSSSSNSSRNLFYPSLSDDHLSQRTSSSSCSEITSQTEEEEEEEETECETVDNGNGGSKQKRKRPNSTIPSPSTPLPTKLFVGRLPPHTTSPLLRSLFSLYGEVLDVFLLREDNRPTGAFKGCCYVRMGSKEESDRAIEGLHKKMVLFNKNEQVGEKKSGKPISVMYATNDAWLKKKIVISPPPPSKNLIQSSSSLEEEEKSDKIILDDEIQSPEVQIDQGKEVEISETPQLIKEQKQQQEVGGDDQDVVEEAVLLDNDSKGSETIGVVNKNK